MANDWFQFKEFKIFQDKCGMKVSTDACLQGAIAAEFILKSKHHIDSGLDIGTGTGLLSLMLVQKNKNIHLTAIDIQEQAAQQAAENFKDSPWENRLASYFISLQEYIEEVKYQTTNKKFDFIICNPPFFQNSLHAPDKKRNTARHNVSLQLEELIAANLYLLNENGFFCILLPENGWDNFVNLAKTKGLYVCIHYQIHPTSEHPIKRNIAFLKFKSIEKPDVKKLIIYQDNGVYTEEFKLLLKDYYLNI